MNPTASNTSILAEYIEKACNKMKVSTEYELCKYINFEDSRIHHFTFKRMKLNEPKELAELIDSQILTNEKPMIQTSKPRQKRNLNTKKFQISLSRSQISKVIAALEANEEYELVQLFSPPPSPKELKRQLIKSIKDDEIDPKLFETYLSLVKKS